MHRFGPNASPWLLVPAVISLALFAWLLTLHPTDAGRVYAAYDGVYVAVALVWLWRVDRAPVTACDLVGSAIAMTGKREIKCPVSAAELSVGARSWMFT